MINKLLITSIQIQALGALVGGLLSIFLLQLSQEVLLSALFGLFAGLINILISFYLGAKSKSRLQKDYRMAIGILCISFLLRFIVLACLFIIGMQLLALNPKAIALVFIFMQISKLFISFKDKDL